jgi:hypothetical protein
MTVFLTQNLHFFTDEACFHLNRYSNAQNNRYWSCINSRQSFEVPLHNRKIHVWCTTTAIRIVGQQTLNSERYGIDTNQLFLRELQKERGMIILCSMLLQHTLLILPLMF